MDFQLSEKQKNLQWAAHEFARGEFRPDLAVELDERRQFPEEIWKKACRLGLVGIHYPMEFGGLGLGVFETFLVIEALCRVDAGFGSALASVDLGSEIILKFGNHEQRKRFIGPLVRGDKRLSLVLPEPTSQSPAAQKAGEGYIVRCAGGGSVHVPLADDFVVLCTETSEGRIALGVERDREGVDVRPVETIGLRMIPVGNVNFKEVRVGLRNRVGQGGIDPRQGHQERRLKNLAQALGAAQGAFDRALHYARQRKQFGRALSQFQIIRHKLAEMAAWIEVIRSLAYQAAVDHDEGRLKPRPLAIAQMEAGRGLVWIADEALQIFGGYGYMAEQEIERCYRDAWALAADLETEEEQKDVIAQEILGPPGPRPSNGE